VKQILVYYIPRGDKFEETKSAVMLSDIDCKTHDIGQIFFPISDNEKARIETIFLKD